MWAVMWQQAKREGSRAKCRVEPISYNQAGSWGRPDSLLNSSKLVRSFPGLAWLLTIALCKKKIEQYGI